MYGHKILAKLDQKKYRDEMGVFVVEGKKGVADAIASQAKIVQLVVTDRFIHQNRDFCQQPAVQKFFQSRNVLTLNDGAFAQLSETTTPQGILAVVKKPETTLASLLKKQTIAILDDIRDPGNVGTMIRTADWFGVDGLLCIGGADPYQPKVVRATMGSIFNLEIYSSDDLDQELTELKAARFTLVVTRPELADASSDPLPKTDKIAIAFGNESRGTSPQLDEAADQSFSLPKFGKAESLNVAMSFGIVLYELRRAA